MLREFQQEIAKLKSALANRSSGKRKKKKRAKTEDGADDGEEEEEEVIEELDFGDNMYEEDFIEEQQAKLEMEKSAIMNDKNMIAEVGSLIQSAVKLQPVCHWLIHP